MEFLGFRRKLAKRQSKKQSDYVKSSRAKATVIGKQEWIENDRRRAYRYYREGRYEDAERLYGRLKKWFENVHGKFKIMGTQEDIYHGLSYLDDSQSLALSLAKQKKTHEAESILQWLVRQREKISPYLSVYTAFLNRKITLAAAKRKEYVSKILLAGLIFDQRRLGEAKLLVEKWFSEYQSGDNHAGWYLNNLANILSTASCFLDAERIIRYALGERDHLVETDAHYALVELGRALNGQERWQEAEEALSNAMEYKSNDKLRMEILRARELTVSLLGQERYDQSESQCRTLLEICTKGHTSECEVAFNPNFIKDNIVEAEKLLERAIKGSSVTPRPSSPEAVAQTPFRMASSPNLETRPMPIRTTIAPTPISRPAPTVAFESTLEATAQKLSPTATSPCLETRSIPTRTTAQTAAVRITALFHDHGAITRFTDAEIFQISSLLKLSDSRCSKFPRTYIVLRQMQCLDLLDNVISSGFSDFHFPATASTVPTCFTPSQRSAFLKIQDIVLTPSLDLEHGGHHHFWDDEPVPFQRMTILGSGSFGEVDKVLSLTTFREYTRKRVPRNMIFANRRQAEMFKQLVTEIQTLKRLKHHHVVDLIGSYTDPQYLGLVMTPIADMDLSRYLADASPSNYPELRTFFGCLAYALKYLHDQNIRHKDVKPSNVLVHQGSVLLTDFGLSFDFSEATGSTTVSMVNDMTRQYAAPEVVDLQPRNTLSDIWSLGIVFLEMLVTLKGRTVKSMREYFRKNRTEEEYIHANYGTLAGYVEDLKLSGRESDNFMVDWILWMLELVKEERPTATMLVGSMAGAPRVEGAPRFCGLCCAVPNGWY